MEFRLFMTVCALSSVVALALILELIRRRRIQDTLWLPWLLVAVTPAVVGLWIDPWARLARWLGITYEPLILVGLASLLSFGMLLYLSVVFSSLLRQNLRLAQELALLRHRVDKLTDSTEQS